MGSENTVKRLTSSRELVKAYEEWLENPVTKLVVDILRNENIPQQPPYDMMKEGVVMGALHGQHCGAAWVIDRMQNLHRGQTEEQSEPQATFGARQILEGMGIKPEEGRKNG